MPTTGRRATQKESRSESTGSRASNGRPRTRAPAASGTSTATRREPDRAGATRNGGAPGPGEHVRVRRFDADRRDQLLTWEDIFDTHPSERQLLWIDVTGDLSEDDATRLAKHFSLNPRTRESLQNQPPQMLLALHREYLHVAIAAEPSDKDPGKTAWLDVIAGNNITITHHREAIDFLADVDDRIERDTKLGILSSPAFFAAILDAAITSYHRAVDAIEEDVDRLDAVSLRGSDRPDLLSELVSLRRRIARLRRLLADHRPVFAGLGSADVASFVGDPDTAAIFSSVSARFEGAVGAVEDSREALLGSFDVFMSRTAQRTNDVMKVLTLTTVLLLPGSLIAGLLGMNVIVPLDKDNPASFWIVVVAIAALAVAIVAVARARHWL